MEGASLMLYEGWLTGRVGQRLVRVGGERADQARPFVGQRLTAAEARGKLLYLDFEDPGHTLRIHCLMFGDVRVNRTRPGKRLTLRLSLDRDKVYVFLGAAKRVRRDAMDPYEPRADCFRPTWDPGWAWARAGGGAEERRAEERRAEERRAEEKKAEERGAENGGETIPAGARMVCDALLDQALFPGLGNKVKNEALYAARVHPATPMARLAVSGRLRRGPDAAREVLAADPPGARLLAAVRGFALDWVDVVHTRGDHVSPPTATYRRKQCPRCGAAFRIEKLGEPPRKTVWCPACQPSEIVPM